MIDLKRDIQSLTTFRRNSSGMLKELKKSKRAVVLTVKGKPAAVVQDAEAYQRLLDIAARADIFEAIRQGMEESEREMGRPARAYFDEFESKNGMPD
jgi:prevent-host-death family protein